MSQRVVTVSDFLKEAAERGPERPALLVDRHIVRFADLHEMSIRVCSYLIESGLHRGDTVLVLWDNGPEYAALYFGIHMAGGVTVPLHPANYAENVRYIATHCHAKMVAAVKRSLVYLDGWWNGPPVLSSRTDGNSSVALQEVCGTRAANHRPSVTGRQEDLAMVLYTSGTTGKPKGVMLSNRNLVANTLSILGYLSLEPDDRTLAILPFCYSYGNSLLLTHVAAGASLVIENRFAFVDRALETMRDRQVTGFSGVPSHYSILINRSRFLSLEWPYLRYMTCAGGALPPVHIRKVRKALPHVGMHVMYGQTEGAARLSSLSPALLDVKTGSIGRGIPGVELRIANKEGRDVSPGETGELIARGENVMMGYLGDPEGTGEVLNDGWLHTGDLATVDADGFIFIQGRAKEFIKTGGFRVGPQQIEEVLLRHRSVCECAVIGLPDEILGERILALVVFREGAGTGKDIESILDLSRKSLPPYMVPARIEPIEAIPKTESGKIRRTELRERFASGVKKP